MSMSVAMSPQTLMVLFVIFIPQSSKGFSFVYPCSILKKNFSQRLTWSLPSYIQIVGHSFGVSLFFAHNLAFAICGSLPILLWGQTPRPPTLVFLQWSGWERLLSLFQQSYKGFKGKFLKISCNKRNPTLLDGFPLYWTKKPTFQGAWCLESM